MAGVLDAILNAATFSSPLASDALYTPSGSGGGQAVSVVVSDPSDVTAEFGGGAVYASGVVIDVSPDLVPSPAAGDTFTVDGEVRQVVGEPRMVSGCWRLNAR